MSMESSSSTGELGQVVLDSLDYVWQRFRDRINGLTDDEYLWEPVSDCWSLEQQQDGRWQVQRFEPEPSPAPVTTIAWRLWHIGSECLAGCTSQGLGEWPLAVHGREWYPNAAEALEALDRAWPAFRAGIANLGEHGLWRPLGPAWEEFAGDPWIGLVLYAQDELSHHSAEVALLRDLYARRISFNPGQPT